jgi:toxin FitB
MPWLIDSDVFIEGERGNPKFVPWLESLEEVATVDIIRGEFLLGCHAVPDAAKRNRGEKFYQERIAGMVSLPCESKDYEKAAQLTGEARRLSNGSPSLADGLLAAIAIRTAATVATSNVKDFQAMGCACANPF